MGITSSCTKTIEHIAFPVPKVMGYTALHPQLFFIGSNREIACMQYFSRVRSKNVILYSHGNHTDIGYMDSFLHGLSIALKTDLVSYDYPGYGLSKGIPSEKGCNEAICKVYKCLLELGYDTENILLYGVSIGTGPTVYLGATMSSTDKSKLKGILLQTPFTSAIGVVSEVVETSCANFAFIAYNPNIFKSLEILPQITTAPISIIHGKKDDIVPYAHAVKLYLANPRTSLITLPLANHNSIDRTDILNCLEKMLS